MTFSAGELIQKRKRVMPIPFRTCMNAEWFFRSGKAGRRKAMQRIVDRSEAKPGLKRRPQLCMDEMELIIERVSKIPNMHFRRLILIDD